MTRLLRMSLRQGYVITLNLQSIEPSPNSRRLCSHRNWFTIQLTRQMTIILMTHPSSRDRGLLQSTMSHPLSSRVRRVLMSTHDTLQTRIWIVTLQTQSPTVLLGCLPEACRRASPFLLVHHPLGKTLVKGGCPV